MANKLITFALVVIALLGVVYVADQAGLIDLQPGPAPRADSLFQVRFVDTSDTDRSENMETIDSAGTTITYHMNDNDMDGLGDVALDIRVTNANTGGADELWLFECDITEVGFTTSAGVRQDIVNMTDLNSRWAVTYTGTEAGAPTIAQSGNKCSSFDWKTGASEQLNIDLAMNGAALDDVASAGEPKTKFMVGGVVMTLVLREA